MYNIEDMNNDSSEMLENKGTKYNEDVKNPLDLIKITYAEFVLEELKKCNAEQLKRSIVRSIPDDVDTNSINNDLIEYQNSTFEYKPIGKGEKKLLIGRSLNGVIDNVIKQKSFSNNKTDKHDKASILITVKTDKESLTSPFTLDAKAKCKFVDFAERICDASNYLIPKGDDNTVKLYRELLNKKCSDTVTLLSNPGSIEFESLPGRIYKNCYTDGFNMYWADENDVVTLPTGRKVMLDKSIGSNLPELYKDEVDIKSIAYGLLSSMDKGFNNRIEPFLALGLGVMGIFTEKLWKNTCGFPTGFLYGKSKQGKGTLQNLINYIYGFDKTFLAMGNSTYRAINRKCNAYNSCIIHLNDMTSNAIRKEGFENNIVQSYENVVRSKMQDGNKFNNLPQCSAMFVSSNYLPIQKEKMLNRILPIYFEANMYNPKEMAEYYKDPRYLSRILPELLKFDFDSVLKTVNEYSTYFAQCLQVEESRESHNLAIAYTGLILLEQISGYSIIDKEKKAVDYFEWYLGQFKELEEPIDAFLNHLHVLIENHMIIPDEHLFLNKNVGGTYTLVLRTQFCLDKFNSYIGKIYSEKFIQPKEFNLSVKASPYYIKTENKRYKTTNKRIPAVASSTHLDVTTYENLYLIEYAIDKVKKEQELLKGLM